MTTQFQSEDFDRSPALSQTAWALQELQLYGTRAFQDEVDLRPMPEAERLIDAVSEPPRVYRRVVCSTTKRPYRVSSGLHRTPPLLLRVGCIRWGREGGGCYTNRPI